MLYSARVPRGDARQRCVAAVEAVPRRGSTYLEARAVNRRTRYQAGRSLRILAPLLLVGVTAGAATAQEDGAALFGGTCVGCHTIGGGRLVGPDLQGVTDRRSEAWLIRFVQHSQSVIASGDSVAVALAAEYPGLVMPDWPLSDAQIRAILAYVAAGAPTAAPAPVARQAATPAQVLLGQDLFQGRLRLSNGGPACNSCHEVTNDAVIGGGVLARELTTVFTRLGGPGVRAVLGSPPFPVMQRAYQGRPLTDDETGALVAFLQDADAQHAFHRPRDYGVKLFESGLVGAALLLGLYTLAWRGRRARSVNQAIFDRQVRSV